MSDTCDLSRDKLVVSFLSVDCNLASEVSLPLGVFQKVAAPAPGEGRPRRRVRPTLDDGLPALLDQRRLLHGVPGEVWRRSCQTKARSHSIISHLITAPCLSLHTVHRPLIPAPLLLCLLVWLLLLLLLLLFIIFRLLFLLTHYFELSAGINDPMLVHGRALVHPSVQQFDVGDV